MTLALIVIGLVLLVAILALFVLAAQSRLSPGPPLTGKTIEIHTCRPDDQTIRGILVAQHADRLTLREPIYRHSSGDTSIGGVVHVPVEQISWMVEVGA